MADRVWISWNEQRRNIGLAAAVGAHLYMTDRKSHGLMRLCQEFYASWRIILREKPKICFTMNPSIFSSWWLSVLARIYGFRLVTDLHTPNLKLTGLKKLLFDLIFNAGIRRSDVVIVTNDIFRGSVLSLNPNVVIIPDPLPALKVPDKDSGHHQQKASDRIKVLFVTSFGEDEPVEEVLALDEVLDGFEILMTGNWKKKFMSVPVTRNIRFMGFVPNDEYDKLLFSVDGVLVLTKEEGCLCCGAYEAFSAGKPLILSKTKALQGFFGKAAIYTENLAESILQALQTLKAEREKRTDMVAEGQAGLRKKFHDGVDNLEKMLQAFT